MKRIKKLLAYFGIFSNNIKIHGIKYDGVRTSKALQGFFLNKNFEIEMFIFLKSLAYDSMIDAGAYFGYFSIYFNKIHKSAEVVAFEADIDNYNRLNHFIKANASTVKAYNQAVGDVKGEIDFYKPAYDGTTKYPTHGQIGDPLKDEANLYKGKRYIKRTVKTKPLKDIISEFANGHTLLKLDIEGYEEKALRSVEKELMHLNDLDIIVELMINDTNASDIFSFMTNCGYSGYLMTNAGLVAEDRPLVMPYANQNPQDQKLRTVWKNHFFTKKSASEIRKINIDAYNYHI
jgi:FkbM family methyltransferase